MTCNQMVIIIPTLNEAENISVLIPQLEDQLPQDSFSIVLVDDNSNDDIVNVTRRMNRRYGNIRLLQRTEKRGIGSAVLDGMRLALSDATVQYLVTMDGDMSHNPGDIHSLISKADEYALVVGSRYTDGGHIEGWGLRRKLISWGINGYYRILFRTGLGDHTSFYRVYSRQAAQTVTAKVKCCGYEFGIAAVLACSRAGLRMTEVPITFSDRMIGKSKLRTVDLIRVGLYATKEFLNGIVRSEVDPENRTGG